MKIISNGVVRCTLLRRKIMRMSREFQRRLQKKYYAINRVTLKAMEEQIKGVYCNVCFLTLAANESAFTEHFHNYEWLADHAASKSQNADGGGVKYFMDS